MKLALLVAALVALAGPASAACVKPEQLATLRGEQDFKQTRTLKGVKRPLVADGTLKAEGDIVVWTVMQPVAIVTRIGPQGVTQAVDGGKAEPVGPAAGNPFFSETGLIDLLRGDLSKLETRYKVVRGTRAKPEGWKLGLTPKAKTVTKYIAGVAIEGCQRVESILVTQANGDLMRIDLK